MNSKLVKNPFKQFFFSISFSIWTKLTKFHIFHIIHEHSFKCRSFRKRRIFCHFIVKINNYSNINEAPKTSLNHFYKSVMVQKLRFSIFNNLRKSRCEDYYLQLQYTLINNFHVLLLFGLNFFKKVYL